MGFCAAWRCVHKGLQRKWMYVRLKTCCKATWHHCCRQTEGTEAIRKKRDTVPRAGPIERKS